MITPRRIRMISALVAVPVLLILLLSRLAPLRAETIWMQTRLSPHLPAFTEILLFLVSPDGKYVIYVTDSQRDNHYNLFKVAIADGKSVQIDDEASNASLPEVVCCEPVEPPTGVLDIAFSPDGKRILFGSDNGYFSVPITGGVPVKLYDVASSDIAHSISPDSRRVVFHWYNHSPSRPALFSVPIEGGAATSLGITSTQEGLTYDDVAITPDSRNVLFLATTPEDQLYTVPITGGIPRKLSSPLIKGGNVDTFVTRDGQSVVYRADQDKDDVWELYSVALAGGPSIKLNQPLGKNGNTTIYQVSPDGQYVVYEADPETDELYRLYSVPISGGTPIELPLPISGTVQAADFYITPDSRSVIYLVTLAGRGWVAIYRVPIEGGTPVQLSVAMPPFGYIDGWEKSQNLKYLAYGVRQPNSNEVELYTVSVADGKSVQLDLSGAHHYAEQYRLTPDGEFVLFGSADYSAATGRLELFRITTGGGNLTRLSTDLSYSGASVWNTGFAPVPGSSTVIYLESQPSTDQFGLFKVAEVDLTQKMLLPNVSR